MCSVWQYYRNGDLSTSAIIHWIYWLAVYDILVSRKLTCSLLSIKTSFANECVTESLPKMSLSQVPMLRISSFIKRTSTPRGASIMPSAAGAAKNLQTIFKKVEAKGGDPLRLHLICDIDGSKPHYNEGYSPCLTKTRAANGGHWCSWVQRKMTTKEATDLIIFKAMVVYFLKPILSSRRLYIYICIPEGLRTYGSWWWWASGWWHFTAHGSRACWECNSCAALGKGPWFSSDSGRLEVDLRSWTLLVCWVLTNCKLYVLHTQKCDMMTQMCTSNNKSIDYSYLKRILQSSPRNMINVHFCIIRELFQSTRTWCLTELSWRLRNAKPEAILLWSVVWCRVVLGTLGLLSFINLLAVLRFSML